MSANLAISPKLSKEELDPDFTIRMIILGPKANVSENEIVSHMHLLDLPITVKFNVPSSGSNINLSSSLILNFIILIFLFGIFIRSVLPF